jgi:hypothetical protein
LDLHCLDEIRNHVFKKVFCPDFKWSLKSGQLDDLTSLGYLKSGI